MAKQNPLDVDRAHLMHPLHHPTAYAKARVWVSGQGALLTDSTGREYIDGLSGLWNVNIGHGRRELGEAASRQMGTLAFSAAYAGGTNERAIELAEKLSGLMYPSINTFFFTSGGAESSETSFKTARFYWKAVGKPEKFKVISRMRAYHGVTLAAMSARGCRRSGRCSSRARRGSCISTRRIRIGSRAAIRRSALASRLRTSSRTRF